MCKEGACRPCSLTGRRVTLNGEEGRTIDAAFFENAGGENVEIRFPGRGAWWHPVADVTFLS